MSELIQGLNIRYRPRNFKDVIGHERIIEILENTIRTEHIPQQILFSGGSGLGKTTLGRIYASAVLCLTNYSERGSGEPCGICASCMMVASGNHPDLIEFDAASNGGKEEIKEIALKAQLVPLIGSRKVYIIDEAHGLSGAGGQAFLKLLEEPPSHIIFILCTTDPEKMLSTNRSRCVEFKLMQPTAAEKLIFVKTILLAEEVVMNDADLLLLINNSDPALGVRGAVSNLSKYINIMKLDKKIQLAEILEIPSEELINELVTSIIAKDFKEVITRYEYLGQMYTPSVIRRSLILQLKNSIAEDTNDLLVSLLGCDNDADSLLYVLLSFKGNDLAIIKDDKSSNIEDNFWDYVGNNFLLNSLLKKSEIVFSESIIEVKADKENGEQLVKYLPELKELISSLGRISKFSKL